MDWVGGAALVLMMLLTSCDVVLRYLGSPIIGAYDFVWAGAAFVFGLALPRTTLDKMHVTVDFFVDWLKIKSKLAIRIFKSINGCIALTFFILLSYNFAKLGVHYFKVGEGTLTIGIPLYIMAFLLMFCAVVQCLVLILQIINTAIKGGAHA